MGSMTVLLDFSDENNRGIRGNKRGLYSGAVGYFTLMAILTLMWSFEVYCTIKKINTFPFR
jgi:hypothetical protein